MTTQLEEVRRQEDGEIEGYVIRTGSDTFDALTVFRGRLATARTREEARQIVHARGLSSLAERWYWRSRESGTWSVVVPQEVRPGSVRVSVGYYSLPGVRVRVITARDLEQGDLLTLERPDAPIAGLPG